LDVIYKICPAEDWSAIRQSGHYDGSADDKRDGFIHFSGKSQLAGTLARHYAGREGLVLLAVDAAALGEALRWEVSRGGEKFPHLFGPLEKDAVVKTWPLTCDPGQGHTLPEDLL
jgi:uncharacterized protein (DUF952 family)